MNVAVGFVCPECGSTGEAALLYMDNRTGAVSLRCMSCEAIWHESGPDEE
jgi:formate dehydrogenase maturation protein FdhE